MRYLNRDEWCHYRQTGTIFTEHYPVYWFHLGCIRKTLGTNCCRHNQNFLNMTQFKKRTIRKPGYWRIFPKMLDFCIEIKFKSFCFLQWSSQLCAQYKDKVNPNHQIESSLGKYFSRLNRIHFNGRIDGCFISH